MSSPAHPCRPVAPPSLLLRWCKFNFVGAIGILVQFAALFLLKSVLHFHYMAATAIAVEAAVVHNFVWHEQFTWVDRVKPSWRTSPSHAREAKQSIREAKQSIAEAKQSITERGFGWRSAFSAAIKPGFYTRALAPGASGYRYRQSFHRLLRFNLTNGAVSLLGNLALMKVMVGQGHMNYLLANAIAIALCSLANFLVSNQWVFGEDQGR